MRPDFLFDEQRSTGEEWSLYQGLFLEKCFSNFSKNIFPNFSKNIFLNFSNIFQKFSKKWKKLEKFGKIFLEKFGKIGKTFFQK